MTNLTGLALLALFGAAILTGSQEPAKTVAAGQPLPAAVTLSD